MGSLETSIHTLVVLRGAGEACSPGVEGSWEPSTDRAGLNPWDLSTNLMGPASESRPLQPVQHTGE